MYWFCMFSFYNFIFQRLIRRAISVYFLWFDYWILKEWKTAKVQNHSVLAYYLYKWLVQFLTCLLVPCLYAQAICASQDWHDMEPRLAWYGSGIASLLSWLKIVNAGWLGSLRSEIFLQMKVIIFQGCPIKQAAFLPGQPAPYNQLLFRHFCLFQNAILHKMLKLGFWNFRLFFIRVQFSLVAKNFSLVLVISLSWYLLLIQSHEFLTFISFNVWRKKCNSI